MSRSTQFLLAAQHGDPQAIQDLFPIVYDELRSIANHHLKDNQLAKEYSSTDLVHEVYMKLIDQSKVDLNSRTHFFALCSKVMRQLLVDRARHNRAARRGSGALHLSLDDTILMRTDDDHVLAIDDALKQLEELDKQQAEIVEMRFYGGMTVAEIAVYLGKSKRSIEAEWTMIRAWLRKELSGQSSDQDDRNDTTKPGQ